MRPNVVWHKSFIRLIVHLIAGSNCLLVLTVKSKNCTKLKCDQKFYPVLQTAYTLHRCRGGHARYVLDQVGPAAVPGFPVGRRRPVGGRRAPMPALFARNM